LDALLETEGALTEKLIAAFEGTRKQVEAALAG